MTKTKHWRDGTMTKEEVELERKKMYSKHHHIDAEICCKFLNSINRLLDSMMYSRENMRELQAVHWWILL